MEHSLDMHPALPAIIALARERLALRRVWLFGSRARRDGRSTSDIDLAFELESDGPEWSRFVFDAEDRARTLLSLDLVNMQRCSPELRKSILADGIVIHEGA